MKETVGILHRETETIRKNQMENMKVKNKISKIKNSLDGLNRRIEMIEERVRNLKIVQYK